MKKSFVFFLIVLTACATPEQIEAQRQAQQQTDIETCARLGFRPKSDGFRNCLLQIELARRNRCNAHYYGEYWPHHIGAGYHWRY